MGKHLGIAVMGTLTAFGAACSDDDAEARTTAAYCAEIQALPEGEGPTDDFFAAHPDPTISDWAEGLPDIIDRIRGTRDDLAAVEPSPDTADEHEAVVAALDAVIANFEDGLVAARASDQAEFDRLEAKNQDEDVPALMDAMAAVEQACASE